MPPAVKTTAVLSSWPLEGGNALLPRQELIQFRKAGENKGEERESFMRLIRVTFLNVVNTVGEIAAAKFKQNLILYKHAKYDYVL